MRNLICFNCFSKLPTHKKGCYILFLQNDLIITVLQHEWTPFMEEIHTRLNHPSGYAPNICGIEHCFYEREEHPVNEHEVLIFKYESTM